MQGQSGDEAMSPTKARKPRVSFADEEGQPEMLPVESSPPSLRSISFGLVRMHGIYILDVMKLDAACVKCSQPLCQQLKACVEEREWMEGIMQVVVLRLEATKEGDLCDSFTVSLQTMGGTMIEVKVMVGGKVMRAEKGTPALKGSVHSIGHVEVDDTDIE